MPEKGSFYLAACSDKPEGGIYRFSTDEQGMIHQTGFTHLTGVSWMNLSPCGKYMYATCTIGKEGGTAALSIADNGDLTLLNVLPSCGISACYTTSSPDGKFVYCANYMTGNLAEFAVSSDGALKSMTQLIAHEGKGPNTARQEGPHVHYVRFTPDNRYLLAIDLGIDALKLYPYTPGKGIDPAGVRTFSVKPAGSGPRHVVFTRSGDRAYLVNELASTVMFLRYSDGNFTFEQTLSALPRNVNCATKASAIRLSPDERFLFASNRGFDSIAVFALAGDGFMTLSDMVLSGGSSPRDIQFLPDGKTFAVCNEFSDTVLLFDYEASTGKLTPNGGKIENLPRPLAVCRD